MQIKFHDRRAIELSKIRPGQIAVGCRGQGMKGDRPIFTKVYVPDADGRNREQIITLSQLGNQYLDKIDPSTPVVLLEKGESIEFTEG